MNHDLLHIDSLKKLCEEIRQEKVNKIFIEEKLKFLLNYYSVLNFVNIKKDSLIFRARKLESNDSYDHVKELGAPPAHVTKANRLNCPLDPVYYLTHNMLCAFDEIRTVAGDRIQVMVYEPNKQISPRLAIIGEKKNVFRRGSSKYSSEIGSYIIKTLSDLFKKDQVAFQSYIYLDSFLSDLLNDKEANKLDYIHTQSLLRLMQKKHPDIKGFMYDGVASDGAINIALDVDIAEVYLKPIYTITLNIVEVYGYGLYKYKIEKKSKIILENGSIVWG
ncbi:hypothetical protein SLJ62_11890 [Acinetobacter pittii]|uniref:hypothetical protein n=1 Tax=Acinetobacter calcoaceticus/baumannii complex TaxID=909768 RepID=UPI00244C9ADC|nr:MULTISPECIES: hypothetical protein [Acinetobacter calcoaceticus/baumannii complex]MDH2624230.1 hypothetical protein [Acinetobacter baumannii]MDX8156247.1 hypothetical protein [Acinetobacter pittii]